MIRIVCVSFCILTSAISVRADELKGHVTVQDCPVANLIVEITPRTGSPQPKVVTNTLGDGRFAADVLPGDYLIEARQQDTRVIQQVVHVSGFTFLAFKPKATSTSIASCGTTQGSATDSSVEGIPADWHPVDLTKDYSGRFLVLDDQGRVSRIRHDQRRLILEKIIVIKERRRPVALAANSAYVYVATQPLNGKGCVIYPVDAKDSVLKPWVSGSPCDGIAANDSMVFLSHSALGSIEMLRSSDLSKVGSVTISNLDQSGKPVPLLQTLAGRNLYVGDGSGSLFAVDLPTRKVQRITRLDGPINSLALADTKMVVAEGARVACVSLAGAPNPTPCLAGSQRHGEISGVLVDGSDTVWASESERNTFSTLGHIE